MYKINELTPEQIKEIQEKYPKGGVKKYQLVEESPRNPGHPSIIMLLGYYSSQQEAEVDAKRWEGREELSDKIQEAFDEAIKLGEKYDINADEVRQMFKEA